jgi:hypothetical protein
MASTDDMSQEVAREGAKAGAQAVVFILKGAAKTSKELTEKASKAMDAFLHGRGDKSGKQSMKDLAAKGKDRSFVEVDGKLDGFEKYANRYKIDYAITYDKANDTTMLAFQGKDMEAVNRAFTEYTQDIINRSKTATQEPVSPYRQAHDIIENIEKKGSFFEMAEKNMIVNYAMQTEDVGKTKTLAHELAEAKIGQPNGFISHDIMARAEKEIQAVHEAKSPRELPPTEERKSLRDEIKSIKASLAGGDKAGQSAQAMAKGGEMAAQGAGAAVSAGASVAAGAAKEAAKTISNGMDKSR